ncbi:hypothetical protein B9G98_00789 [Wickerhamiella sorbophila]|uniref:Aldehyde dehydrogenase domain-containing protein n=1 Tax=Wickerhamiella sorbophila TaxID=45607 RepID=A0A2T0FE07_9ASCO|nr:hypothetical protein B9G98_00789 [Wickerhamiella sorbophila]PRT53169.1 hypothetical protein B9G98_00789 [Wickerhamiella sorbophila]
MEILDHIAAQTAITALVGLLALPLTYLMCARFLFRGSRNHEGIQFSLPIPEAAQEHWKGKRVSVMNIRDESDPQYIKALCPATGQLLGSFKAADEAAIDDTLARATAAQRKWGESSFDDRRRVLKTIARYISDHQREVARVACRDTGKTMLDAALGEIMVTLEKIKWLIKHGEDALTPSKRPGSTNVLLFYKGAEVRYEPLGVVCAMVSWNYPLHNLMGPVVAGLFAGNSVVVKGSEQVVWSSEFFVQIAKRALELEGFDPETVQLISCWPEHADYLTSHPAIKHITFIGSCPVAHSVCTAAARSLTPVVTELGGKDPLVVLDDVSGAKVKEIASIIMRGVFQSAGQNCIGVERVIALPKTHDALLDIFKKRVPQLRLGSSIDELANIDMGALIAAHHLDRLEALVSDAVAQGAVLEAGGKRFAHPKYPLGIYFEPTLLSGVTKDMKIAQEEVFGPILLLMKAESVDDAIEIANSTQFALGASVFGSSSRDVDRCVKSIRAGNVAINDFATYHLCQLPFGGVGGSGYGKFGGAEGLRGLCLEKSVCYDRFPFISTFIPRALDYPIPSVAKAWSMVRALNDLGYAQSGWVKFKALRRLLGI